jgi:hypothetical protein
MHEGHKIEEHGQNPINHLDRMTDEIMRKRIVQYERKKDAKSFKKDGTNTCIRNKHGCLYNEVNNIKREK